MIRRLFIANRGEIALRILRSAARLGVECVIGYSAADADSLPVRLADRGICIGPANASQSYLNVPAVVHAAKSTGSDAVHPGYGFLAESADLAQACLDQEIIFVGPPPPSLELAGDKLSAREAALRSGIPVTPGSKGEVESAKQLRAIGEEVGYPLMLKAAAGGGGKGMRLLRDAEDADSQFDIARRESLQAFGKASVYAEKLVRDARHVEVQIVASRSGSAVAIGDRECSIQRRHQKLIEEAPVPNIPCAVRESIARYGEAVMNEIGYSGVGTVEFLYDPHRDASYFIEINPRIQVEHPVTEMVTGWDLVSSQLAIASGEPPEPPGKKGSKAHGTAIECRITAEDVDQGFAPSPGLISEWRMPGGPGVRIDSHCFAGYRVPPYYDSLLGKLVVHGRTRSEALQRLGFALEEAQIAGVETTLSLHRWIIQQSDFVDGKITTEWLEKRLAKRAG